MKKLLALATLVCMTMAFTPAQASSESQTYVANGLYAFNYRRNTPAVQIASNGNFNGTGDPTHIRVRDTSGNDVSFTVCQEGPADETEPGCGNGDDASQDFCSTGSNQALSTAFRASGTNPILVFIDPQDPLTDCTGIGSTGTVTLTWT